MGEVGICQLLLYCYEQGHCRGECVGRIQFLYWGAEVSVILCWKITVLKGF